MLIIYLAASIRSLRKKRPGNRPPIQVVTPPRFGPEDDASSSSSSSDDEAKTPSPGTPGTTFNVIHRDRPGQKSGIVRTAKDGEMNNVAKVFAGTGPARAKWTDMPEVIRRNLVEGMTGHQRSLQEVRHCLNESH